ncbi:EKC/KEOPS complex subunit LAGE3 [Pteronotus mesoamericanus]|uniref:EKC/KEOPS complex subunit LAGE3 n=1 Tax=Pteronotus mesoamericanus TaxID=1884717 RepID=UPI0023EC7CB4|nr:EKC/KEOPS complex subunit LAGE3 [Pteronotus parnellii mesoamericanus]
MLRTALRGRGRRRSVAAMQAPDAGPTGAHGQDSQDGYGTPRGAGEAATVAGGAPRVARAQNASGRGEDAALTVRRPENRLHTFALRVPFPSPLEADIACGSLAPDAEPHREAIRKELTVSGSVLAVFWRAEDAHLLRISIINFLDQLSLVMRTMQRFGPPLCR